MASDDEIFSLEFTQPVRVAGLRGPRGYTGAQGPVGPAGADGANGTNGTNGVDGATGATGATGPIGTTGAAGADGADGIDGADGTDGIDGTNGIDGLDGDVGPAGSTGPAGIQGVAGFPGSDGSLIYTGSGAPGSGLGANGDYYIEPGVGLLYGPKASGAWPSGVAIFVPDEVVVATGISAVAGTKDGSNTSFTLVKKPNPTTSLQIFVNGILQLPGGVDYTLTVGTYEATISFVTAPASTDKIAAIFTYLASANVLFPPTPPGGGWYAF